MNDFFAGREESARIFETLRSVIGNLGPAELRVTKSQIAFRRRKAFAWAWIPSASFVQLEDELFFSA